MDAEIIEVKKRKDGIFVVVQCGDRRESTLFNPIDATENNITQFAENVQKMYDDLQVPISNLQLDSLQGLVGKKYDKISKRLK